MKFFKVKKINLIILSCSILCVSFFWSIFFIKVTFAATARVGCFEPHEIEGQSADYYSCVNKMTKFLCLNECPQNTKDLKGCWHLDTPCPRPIKTVSCISAQSGFCYEVPYYGEAIDLQLSLFTITQQCVRGCSRIDGGCIVKDGTCQENLKQEDLRPDSRPKFGCIHGVVCDDLPAKDSVDANTVCLKNYGNDSVPLITPCPSKGDWACFKATKCTNVQAAFYQEAQSLCPNGDVAKEKISCATVLSSSTLNALYRPLAGTSLVDLQEMAAKQLNQGHISEPTTLISRAINFLTGILGSIALLLYVVSGLLWMTARGASEQVDRAKKIMVWTTLGVVVTLFSYILTTMLFGFIPKLM